MAAATVEDAHNKAFVRRVSVRNLRGSISAKVELDVKTATGVKRQEVTVSDGDDLQQTTQRAIYTDFRMGEINTTKGSEFLELRFPGGEAFLALGQAHGDVDALAVPRQMIRRTIREHLEKETLLRPKGIKVPTPLGAYNPDWAILLEHGGAQRLYFVVETKSSLFTDDLRDKESAKMECGKAHFAALAVGESPAKYLVATSLKDVLSPLV